jgi:uncharacterized membrane protein
MNMTPSAVGKMLLRYGFVFVFLWFGLSQVLHPDMWTSLIPGWILTTTGLSAHAFVLINGVGEIILALALTFNIFTPIVATLLSLHLLSIAIDLKFDAVGIRDVGLAVSVLALAFLSWEK